VGGKKKKSSGIEKVPFFSEIVSISVSMRDHGEGQGAGDALRESLNRRWKSKGTCNEKEMFCRGSLVGAVGAKC